MTPEMFAEWAEEGEFYNPYVQYVLTEGMLKGCLRVLDMRHYESSEETPP